MIFVRQTADLKRNTTQTRIRLQWYSIRSKPKNFIMSDCSVWNVKKCRPCVNKI